MGRKPVVSVVSAKEQLTMQPVEAGIYDRSSCVTFRSTSEKFGGLSNMAPGFPLAVNGIHIRTSEALYQACRFPHMPDVQRMIFDEISPMTAKMKSKRYRKLSRPDWDEVGRLGIMRWCLRVKLAQNWDRFGGLLRATGAQDIVEESRKDVFWGAKLAHYDKLVGSNVLGRMLMELRDELLRGPCEGLRMVEPPNLPDCFLCGEPVRVVERVPLTASSKPPQRQSRPQGTLL